MWNSIEQLRRFIRGCMLSRDLRSKTPLPPPLSVRPQLLISVLYIWWIFLLVIDKTLEYQAGSTGFHYYHKKGIVFTGCRAFLINWTEYVCTARMRTEYNVYVFNLEYLLPYIEHKFLVCTHCTVRKTCCKLLCFLSKRMAGFSVYWTTVHWSAEPHCIFCTLPDPEKKSFHIFTDIFLTRSDDFYFIRECLPPKNYICTLIDWLMAFRYGSLFWHFPLIFTV
jgi:hypothetical protein